MPGVVNTTHVFANNQVITSTLMNNIIDETTFTSQALAAGTSTLALVSGRIKVATGGIASNELATGAVTNTKIFNDAVTTSKILDLNVTTGKIADLGVTTGKIADLGVTTAKIANLEVTTGKIADAAITSTKLSGAQTGNAPVFGIRAAGEYTLSNPRVLTTGLNIASVTRTANGASQITFTIPMPNSNYVVLPGLGRGTSGFSRDNPPVAHTLTTSGFKMSEVSDSGTNGVSFYVIG